MALSLFIKIGLPSGVFSGITCNSPALLPVTIAHSVGLLRSVPSRLTSISATTNFTSDKMFLTRIDSSPAHGEKSVHVVVLPTVHCLS